MVDAAADGAAADGADGAAISRSKMERQRSKRRGCMVRTSGHTGPGDSSQVNEEIWG